MPQTRFQAVLLGTLVAFGAWTAVVLTPPLAAADLAITRWVQHYASPALDTLLSVVTILGNAEVTALLAALMGLVLIRRGQAALAFALWAIFVGGSGMEWLAKHWLPHLGVPASLQRSGVNILHHQFHTPYSYFSGHAFRTLLLATAASWLWPQARGSASWLRYALGTLVVVMGIALIYLGDHWASEVVGGYLLGGAGVVLLRTQQRESTSPSSAQLWFR